MFYFIIYKNIYIISKYIYIYSLSINIYNITICSVFQLYRIEIINRYYIYIYLFMLVPPRPTFYVFDQMGTRVLHDNPNFKDEICS